MTTTLKEVYETEMNRLDDLRKRNSFQTLPWQQVEGLFHSFALKVAEAAREATSDPTEVQGYNATRQESLTRWNIFIGNNDK